MLVCAGGTREAAATVRGGLLPSRSVHRALRLTIRAEPGGAAWMVCQFADVGRLVPATDADGPDGHYHRRADHLDDLRFLRPVPEYPLHRAGVDLDLRPDLRVRVQLIGHARNNM